MKFDKFPVGHPKIYIGNERYDLIDSNMDLSKVEGLVKCVVLPPRNLHLPVVPVRGHNRLLFPLCRKCMEELNTSDCNHENINDRSFTGTWVSDELKVAVSKGYRILKVHEIWHYKIEQYDKTTNSGGIFTEYMDNFFKIKILASGFPNSCTTEHDKDSYVKQLRDIESIDVDKEKISKNPGLRSVAKLCLNCLWGRFGMRENLPKTSIVRSREHLLDLLTDPAKEVLDIINANDNTLYVSWRCANDDVVPLNSVNVVIAAYTTAQARLKLYSYLDKLDKRVLYFDTDSCIYVSGENEEYEPELGNFLGQMTNELECYGEGSYIQTFVSGGPKFYALRIIETKDKLHYIIKIKGISLNSSTADKINFEAVKTMVLNNESVTLNFPAIRRTKCHEVITKTNEIKTCKPN